MEIIRNRPSRLQSLPIDGNGSDIQPGAVLMPGVTADNNLSVAILATGAAADSIGLLAELHDFSISGDSKPDVGDVHVLRGIEPFLPGCEVAALMADDADNDVDVASATSTVLTITSVEDNIDGSWVYVRAGTGAGLLLYCDASASGTLTLKVASTTTLDNTSKLVILRRLFHKKVELDSTGTKIKSTAAAGSLPWRVIGNQFRKAGQEIWVDLDPSKHHNLNLSGQSPVFRQILVPVDTLHNPVAV